MKCPKPRIFLEILGHFPEISRFSGMIVFEKKHIMGLNFQKLRYTFMKFPFSNHQPPLQ